MQNLLTGLCRVGCEILTQSLTSHLLGVWWCGDVRLDVVLLGEESGDTDGRGAERETEVDA